MTRWTWGSPTLVHKVKHLSYIVEKFLRLGVILNERCKAEYSAHMQCTEESLRRKLQRSMLKI